MLDHFQMGPNLVRGFAPAGIGPRDLTLGTIEDALGGTMYWGASVEAQSPIPLPAEGRRHEGCALFADAGSLWDYKGPTFWTVTGETVSTARADHRPSITTHARPRVGRRRPDLGFAVRAAALRLRDPAPEAGWIRTTRTCSPQFAVRRRYQASESAAPVLPRTALVA